MVLLETRPIINIGQSDKNTPKVDNENTKNK